MYTSQVRLYNPIELLDTTMTDEAMQFPVTPEKLETTGLPFTLRNGV